MQIISEQQRIQICVLLGVKYEWNAMSVWSRLHGHQNLHLDVVTASGRKIRQYAGNINPEHIVSFRISSQQMETTEQDNTLYLVVRVGMMQTWLLALYSKETDAVTYAKNYAATEPDDWHCFQVIAMRTDTCHPLPVAQTKKYATLKPGFGQVLHEFSNSSVKQ